MELKDILTLSDRGFTPEQIMTLAGIQPSAPAAAEEPVEIKAEEPVAEPQPAEQPSAQPSVNEVLRELERLKTMMFKQNISQTEMSSPQTESVTDILASLINGRK